MTRNDLSVECTYRGIDDGGKNREGMIHALQEYGIRADQTWGEPETATLEPSGSETASQDGQAETDTEVSLNVTSKPQHEQASPRLPANSIDSSNVGNATTHREDGSCGVPAVSRVTGYG